MAERFHPDAIADNHNDSDRYVLASDYDALAAELSEARDLLMLALNVIRGEVGSHRKDLNQRIADFLIEDSTPPRHDRDSTG